MGLLVSGYITVFFHGLFWIQKDEAHGVGIGTAGDAALEEISRVHRLVSRQIIMSENLNFALLAL
jgi:hypothetical protein